MPDYCDVIPVPRHLWAQTCRGFLDDSYQQLWEYGEAVAARFRCTCEHVAIRMNDEIIGAATVRLRQIPLLGGGLAYLSGGPITRRGRADDVQAFERALDALQQEYVDRRGMTLRVLAPIGSPEWNRAVTTSVASRAATISSSARRYRTLLVEIDRSEEEILAGCSKYWRRNLRRADRAEFYVRSGTDLSLFDQVIPLHRETVDRKRFRASLDAPFYRDLQTRLQGEERLFADVVELDGHPVAGLLSSHRGDTCVPLVLAATELGLTSYAAYLLQWTSIQRARSMGMRFYDMGGIDPEENPGVFNFKQGVRGVDLTAPGPIDLRAQSVRAKVTEHAERLYRRLAV